MTLLTFVNYIILPVLGISLLLLLYRLITGPHMADRVVALDLINTIGIGIIATYAVATEESNLLDVAIVMALISFLGTVGFAIYWQRGTPND